MTTQQSRIIACGAIGAMIAVCTGCKSPEKAPVTGLVADRPPWNTNAVPRDVRNINLGNPDGNGGTLSVPITLFSPGDNGLGCFPAQQGWSLFWVTFFFLGPNATATPNNYPNLSNTNSFTIHTLDTANGTALDTGILIVDNLNPQNFRCNDDASPPFANNAKLSKATFAPTGNLKKYRVGIYYKGPAPPGLTEIKVRWNYP